MEKQRQPHIARALFATAVALTLMISGCMVGPDYHAPQTPAPTAWAGVSKESTSQPSAATSQPEELAQWWETLGDPKLTALVNEALQANLSLQLAQARLRQARSQRGVVVGGLLPAVNGAAGYQRARPAAGTGSSATAHSLFQTGLDASWELDVFGGVKRNVESADAGILAAQDSVRAVQVSLAAEMALDYVLLRGYQQQIVIARNNLKAQQHTAGITRHRFSTGFVSGLDVANADALVATTESIIPLLEMAAQQSIYGMSVLLARPPADLLKELAAPGSLPATPHEIPIGLPSELLRRRPDIRVAEAQLHAAMAQIGVATADLFPKFSLTGNIGWQNSMGRDLFKDASRSWSFGPSMTWAIFQGGSIVSNIQVQEALRDQAYIVYKQTVLTALQEVENALIALAKEQESRKSLTDAVAANRKAVNLSMHLYTQGQTDFLNVLNAQRSLFASEDALVLTNRNVATDLVALYKALGGGWEGQPQRGQPTSAPTTSPATAPAK
jgi:NodT family efflux transporter outer membrane factor (OMF) lipoprotein